MKKCNAVLFRSGVFSKARLLALAGLLLLFAACDDDSPWDDEQPPAGLGALVVDNLSSDRLDLFIAGELNGNVRGGRYRYIELAPGVYRIVLMSDDGFRSYRNDIDVVEERKSVIEISSGDDIREYDARIYFD